MEHTKKEFFYDSRAEIFKYITFAIGIIGIIAGILCGTLEMYSYGIDFSGDFNFAIALIVWLITVPFAIGSWIVYCTLIVMEQMLIELGRANIYHNSNAEDIVVELRKANSYHQLNADKKE